MSDFQIFWGEMHDNTHQFTEQTIPFAESLRRASSHLDFYAAAYYTACSAAFTPGGHLTEKTGAHSFPLEGWKSPERLQREWAEVVAGCRAANQPGSFVAFPGYEWQGNGTSGDHNVCSLRDDLEIFRVDTVAELYSCLRNCDALAIPHHTAYRPDMRGRDWRVFDEFYSPFTEIFSVHGCSETDEEWLGMRQNSHMGPGVGAGTWEAALDRGLHLGAIASTDNWGEMPGHYGRGRVACMARELTRESLWDAFRNRRVYAVTGDRIRLDFQVNGAPMGRVIGEDHKPRRIRIRVHGSDAIDRIELLRNGQVLATHCHQGTWRMPDQKRPTRFKMRIEAGWGPRPGEMSPRLHDWGGCFELASGRILNVEKCWISPGHPEPEISGNTAKFGFRTSTQQVGEPHQNALVFEFEAPPETELCIRLNGQEERASLAAFSRFSRGLWFDQDCVQMLAQDFAIAPHSPERNDIYHHLAYKAKLHRPIPSVGYEFDWELEDPEFLPGETCYRVRMEQRNGQRAWSSPIWITPG